MSETLHAFQIYIFCMRHMCTTANSVSTLMQALATGEETATVEDFMNVKADPDLICL